jgi:hypothetical protein
MLLILVTLAFLLCTSPALALDTSKLGHATVRITGRHGQAFETITTNAMKNATNLSETNLNWRWTTEFPPEVPIKM